MPLGKTGCLWGLEPAETFLPEGSLLVGLDLSTPNPTCLVHLWVIHEPCPAHQRCQAPSNLRTKAGAWVPETVCCQATKREVREDSHRTSSGGEGHCCLQESLTGRGSQIRKVDLSLQADISWEGSSSLVSRGRRAPMSWAGQAAQEAVEAPPREASPGLPNIQPPRQAPKMATRPGCSEPVLPTHTVFLQVSPWVISKDPLDSGSS